MRQRLTDYSPEVIDICKYMEQAQHEDDFLPRLLNASYQYIRRFKRLPMMEVM